MRILKITLENVRYETQDKLSVNELIKSYNEHADVFKTIEEAAVAAYKYYTKK